MNTVINRTNQYYNQYFDIKDRPETKQDEKDITCNVSCVAMITGENPNDVLKHFLGKYGQNKKFQWEENLICYLTANGCKCLAITDLAWPKIRTITEKDLAKMRKEIDDGKIIFYHEKGHYSLMIGYQKNEDGQCFYFFNDPAGDRQLNSKGSKDSGFNVKYSKSFLESKPLYGRCWAVTV